MNISYFSVYVYSDLTPLHAAAANNNKDVLITLLDNGADINAIDHNSK